MVFKFGYNGRRYDGFAFQNIDDPPKTVEMRILEALRKVLNREDEELGTFHKDIALRSASRTDKGVSALGNVVSLETDKDPADLARSLNALVKDCFFWAYAKLDGDFKSRHASSRWYRYHLPGDFEDHELRRMVNTAHLFFGEHDFKCFSKYDRSEPKKSTVREILELDINEKDGVVVIDIRADGFLWHMVRMIVWTLVKSACEEISMTSIYNLLDEGVDDTGIGLSPAEPLVLMDVDYKDVHFTRLPDVKKDEMVKRMMSLKDELRFMDLSISKILD